MSNFASSSHCTHWLFSEEKLQEVRNHAYHKLAEKFNRSPSPAPMEVSQTPVKSSLVSAMFTPSPAPSPMSTTPAGAQHMLSPQTKTKFDLVTPAEQVDFLRFYATKIVTICNHFKFPPKVMAASIAYLKRFFLHNSIMEFDYKYMMFTCVYIACKVEEVVIRLEDFLKTLGLEASALTNVVNNEVLLLDGLRYQLIVFHPYRPLTGFVEDLTQAHRLDAGAVEALSQRASSMLDQSLLTDAVFLHPPAQIALAALAMCANEFNVDIDGYIQSRFGADDNFEELKRRIAMIQRSIQELAENPIKMDEIQRIDAKVLKLKGKASDMDAKVGDEKKREKEERRLRKQKKKLERLKREQDALLGFGVNGEKLDDGEFKLSVGSLSASKRRRREQDAPTEDVQMQDGDAV